MHLVDLTAAQLHLAESQGGLLTEGQARGLLGGAAAVRVAVQLGALERTSAGVVALPGSADPMRALRAAALALSGSVVCGPSAAVVHGFELPAPPRAVHLMVGRDRSRARAPGAVIHRRALQPDEVELVDGLPVLTPIATLVDLARRHTLTDAVVASDSALRARRCTMPELHEACLVLGRHARPVRLLPRLVDPLAMSALESMCRLLLALAGLPAPLTQFEVRDHDGVLVGRVDFAWPGARLLLETDGYAWHREREDYRADRERANAYARLGWTLLRVTWEDVVHRPEHVVALVSEMLARRGRPLTDGIR